MAKRIQCSVTGRVQMVMFRDFTQRSAKALGLVGSVKNNHDKSVTVIAEGPEDKLQRLISRLKEGSLLSRVDNVEVEWKDSTGEFTEFSISY